MMDEITADFHAATLLPEVPLKTRFAVTVAAKTDLGRVRENNEDKFEFYRPTDPATLARRGEIYLVCDGMGGHSAGQIASEIAIKTFLDVYLNHPAAEPNVMAAAGVAAAHRFVTDIGLAIPSRKGMGTTLTGLIFHQGGSWVVQVGDSRCYRLRAGAIELLTADHTWVEEVVRQGMMSRHDAENHPYKHVITRAIGAEGTAEPDLIPVEVLAGDTFLLCSDGLVNHVEDARIGEILTSEGPAEACWKLVAEALAGGGSDNVTTLIARVDGIDHLAGA